jgi:putative transposase
MIDPKHSLSIKRQAELVGISRGSVYYLPKPVSQEDLALMRRMDLLHLEHPFMGSRMLRDMLNRQRDDQGQLYCPVGRKRVRTLMARMGIEALYRKPGTSKKHPGHTIYPYLLRGVTVERTNQVWALDTTYVPMARGFVYLTVVIDVASRRALAWKVAITLEACHATEILEQAFARFGVPEIVNTDQGSQFTANTFTETVLNRGCKLSMDGRGAWRDNVFVERLWRTVKYEEVYLKAYESVSHAKESINRHLNWYNESRPHSSLGKQTPNEAYTALLPAVKLAA